MTFTQGIVASANTHDASLENSATDSFPDTKTSVQKQQQASTSAGFSGISHYELKHEVENRIRYRLANCSLSEESDNIAIRLLELLGGQSAGTIQQPNQYT
jgi:hypothetical protein